MILDVLNSTILYQHVFMLKHMKKSAILKGSV